MTKTIYAADLFCGAGGSSEGLARSCEELGTTVDLVAINHSKAAITTHEKNFPWARHYLQNIDAVDPRDAVPGGHLHILTASPECTHHSRAAGGRPKNDQSRSSAWNVLRWIELLKVDNVLIENVPEFMMWGPLDRNSHPIRSRKGEIYQAYLSALRSFRYNVDARVLNSANYGAATARSRLFIVARKGNKPIIWPEPTHDKRGRNGLPKWRAAREIIDWSIKGQSIFTRKKPLSPATIRRIIAGLKRFGGPELQPFLVLMEHQGGIRSLDQPIPTITTARGGSFALVDPVFTLSQASGGAPRSVNDPLATTTARGGGSIVQSCLIPSHGERKGQKTRAHSVDTPVPTIAATGHVALAEAAIIHYHGGDKADERSSSVEEPLNTIDTSNRHGIADACLLPVRGFFGKNTAKSVEDPLGTITQRGYGGVVESCLVQYNGMSDAQSVDDPLGTVTTRERFGIAEPYLVQFQGTTDAALERTALSLDEPLGTVTSSGHFALVQPEINGKKLDIRFRMLQPHELSGAMGFPSTYFEGLSGLGLTKQDIIRQIGNAIEVRTAKALFTSLLNPPQISHL
jgi:DNA (cytosine-5)-methyltransferase 1